MIAAVAVLEEGHAASEWNRDVGEVIVLWAIVSVDSLTRHHVFTCGIATWVERRHSMIQLAAST